jgi:NADH-ubiquinone oxidoreductase chain 3
MSSFYLLFIITPILAGVLLLLNYLLSVHKPDIAKTSPFECGFSSFNQTRNPFHLHFFLVALLFLIFDLEIALIYPYLSTTLYNQSYGF